MSFVGFRKVRGGAEAKVVLRGEEVVVLVVNGPFANDGELGGTDCAVAELADGRVYGGGGYRKLRAERGSRRLITVISRDPGEPGNFTRYGCVSRCESEVQFESFVL